MTRLFLLFLALVFAGGEARAEPWWLERGVLNQPRRIAIIGPTDDRLLLAEDGHKLGFSKDDIDNLLASTGYFYCDATTRGSYGSAVVILDNKTLLTAAHMLFDDDGNRRGSWSACYFETQNSTKLKFKIDLTEGNYLVGTTNPKRDAHLDWAIVRLTEPAESLRPLAVDLRAIVPSDEVFQISAASDGFNNNKREALFSPCKVRRVFPKTEKRELVFYTDCDTLGGSSGGATIAKYKGNFVLVGIVATSSDEKMNFLPYQWPGDDANYSHHIGAKELVERAAVTFAPQQRLSEIFSSVSLGDRVQLERVERAMLETKFPVVEGQNWTGPSGAKGNVRIIHITGESEDCRTLRHQIMLSNGETRVAQGQVCKDADGKWVAKAQ